MADQKKFLDAEGVKYLWSKINMQDYPNNETLMGVIEAIDETKADKSELFSGSWNDLEDKPFIGKTIVIDGSQVDSTSIPIAGYRKVSDYVPSKEELLGGSIKYAHNSTATTITEDNLKTNNYYISGTDCLEGSYFLVVPKDTGNYKKGIYYRSTASYNHILTFTSNKTLDTNKVRVEWDGIDNKPEQYPTNWDLVENKPEEFISSWEKVNNKPLNHISKATISEPESQPGVGHAGIYLDDFYHLSGVMPTLEDFSEGYDVITFWPVETIHYDSSTVLTGDYFDSGFYNVYDSNGQFIIFYEDGNLSDGRDVKKGTYLNTNLITSLIVKPQTVLDPVQIKVDWDGVINKPNFALKEEFHKIAQSGSWNDLEDKPFGYKDEYVTIIEEETYENGSPVSIRYLQSPGTYNIIIDKENVYTITKLGGPSNLGDSTYQNYPFFMEFRGSYYITFEDGQPHLVEFKQLRNNVAFPIDEVFIPDTIARLDYVDNQINTHTHDFDTLTNKPFYENVTITQLDAMKNQAPGIAAVSLPMNLTKGEYLVKFNEVEYSIFVDENTTRIESTNLPFIINKSGNEYSGFTWVMQSVDKSTPFTYEISSVERDLKQLDKKFIPNEITDKLNNCLTSKDILIVDLDTEYIFSSDWKNRVKEAHANGQYILIKYNNIYYNITVTEDEYCVGYAFISQSRISGFWHDLNQTEGMSYASSAIDLEEARNKISNWSNEQSGSTKNYPSINAMEEYVNNQVNSTLKNVQPDWNASEDQPGHILNRTHYVEQTVINPIYNGDPIGKEIVQLNPQIQYIKMSDNPIVDESYIGSQVIWVDPNGENTMTLTEYDRVTADVAFSGLAGYAIKLYGMAYILCITEESSFGDTHFTPGTWFMDGGIMYTKSWSCLPPVLTEIVHKIPIKYLPEEVTKEREIEVISDETIDFICGRLSGWQEDNDIITDENNSVLLFTNY